MAEDDARARVQKLLVTGDNRLKQGVDPEKARESYLQALQVAREAGLEEQVRPLVELRLNDLRRLSRESPPLVPPEAGRRPGPLRRAGPRPVAAAAGRRGARARARPGRSGRRGRPSPDRRTPAVRRCGWRRPGGRPPWPRAAPGRM